MSDAGGGKKPPVDPQAGPGPGPGRAAGERGLSGSFPLVLKKLMENPPREARLGEGGGVVRAGLGGGAYTGAGPREGGAGEAGGQGTVVQRSSGGGWGPDDKELGGRGHGAGDRVRGELRRWVWRERMVGRFEEAEGYREQSLK